jgi:hypothetical protein
LNILSGYHPGPIVCARMKPPLLLTVWSQYSYGESIVFSSSKINVIFNSAQTICCCARSLKLILLAQPKIPRSTMPASPVRAQGVAARSGSGAGSHWWYSGIHTIYTPDEKGGVGRRGLLVDRKGFVFSKRWVAALSLAARVEPEEALPTSFSSGRQSAYLHQRISYLKGGDRRPPTSRGLLYLRHRL